MTPAELYEVLEETLADVRGGAIVTGEDLVADLKSRRLGIVDLDNKAGALCGMGCYHPAPRTPPVGDVFEVIA